MSEARAERLPRLPPLLALVRPTQWLKNGIVLAPVVFSGRLFDPGAEWAAAIAFASLSLAASAGYVWNDLRDAEADRRHPTKRQRPIASGRVPPQVAGGLLVALAIAAVGLPLVAARLSPPLVSGFGLAGIVGAYLVVSVLYTLWWKHVAIVDVLAIGAFFILRVEAGAVACGIVASNWLLMATGLGAVFIGLGKRRHELLLLESGAGAHRAALGDYGERFLDAAISVATSATLVTYLLYATSDEVIHRVGPSGMLAGAPFVFYGLLRYLHLIYSRDLGGDPTELLASDRGILAAIAGFAAAAAWVIYT